VSLELPSEEQSAMPDGSVLIVGGTGGLGREVAAEYHRRGAQVIVSGRDAGRSVAVAAEIGKGVTGIGVDLSHPETVAAALADVGPVSRLVVAAIARDNNPVREYTIERAIELTTMKLVGYTETVHALLDRLSDESSVVLFGGRAKDRPYPGSTTVTTVNGGISALIHTLAIELAPIRFNAVHPGIVGDSPFWSGKPLDAVLARTPTNRLVTMAEVVDATVFLLENRAMNGANLYVDGGWMLR
jgi:NAD(P)-dependent dehydrogenase (short-subunit alcohol dehydrogenase family)